MERYFRAKLIEPKEYRVIDSWCDSKGDTDSKGSHQQCEIDIIAVKADDKKVDIIEVKLNPDKFNRDFSINYSSIAHFATAVKFTAVKKRLIRGYS